MNTYSGFTSLTSTIASGTASGSGMASRLSSASFGAGRRSLGSGSALRATAWLGVGAARAWWTRPTKAAAMEEMMYFIFSGGEVVCRPRSGDEVVIKVSVDVLLPFCSVEEVLALISYGMI